MRTLATIAVTMCAVSVWATPVPPELAQALRKREAFYHNRYIEFRFASRYILLKPRYEEKYKRQNRVEVWRTPSATKVLETPLNGKRYKVKKQDNEVSFSMEGGTDCVYYYDGDVIVTLSPNIVFSPGTQEIEATTLRAEIRRSFPNLLCSDDSLQRGDVCGATFAISALWGAFTVGLNLLNCPNFVWEKVEERNNQWILIGKKKQAESGDINSQGEPYVIRLVLQKPDALPIEMEFLKPLSNNHWSRTVLRTKTTKQEKGFRIPALIESHSDNSDQSRIVTASCEILRFESIKQAPTFDLPLGTEVKDSRFEREAYYAWRGRLPTQSDLQRMLYEQGRLLPPESSRTRYSWVMFVPAILFFLAALWLYWRMNRR